MLIIGFIPFTLYKKIGGILFLISVLSFLVGGLVVLTGEDVAFFTKQNPSNMTIIITNNTSGRTTTTTYHSITPENQTNYLIGNGQFPITGVSQLWMGITLITLGILSGALMIDQAMKHNLFLY